MDDTTLDSFFSTLADHPAPKPSVSAVGPDEPQAAEAIPEPPVEDPPVTESVEPEVMPAENLRAEEKAQPVANVEPPDTPEEPTPAPVPATVLEPIADPEQTERDREEREARRLARLEEHRQATRLAAASRATRPKVRRPSMALNTGAEEKKPATTTTTTPTPSNANAKFAYDPSSAKPKPARLRLDPVPEEPVPPPTKRFRLVQRLLAPFAGFYDKCPNCQSTEIYGVNPMGEFILHESEQSPFYQRFQCERCISAFARPGSLLGAPPPQVRPEDRDMYG